jgi:uncharacterized protein YndB with AHSA1/START domain
MCKTIKQKVRFKAPPEAVYSLLADSAKRTRVTGLKADISRKVGGAFSADNGRVTGVNVDLVAGKRIVQAWRRADFPEGVYSMATFNLTRTPDGGTELVLTHRGVPKWLIDGTEENWRNDYWARMKAHLARSAG